MKKSKKNKNSKPVKKTRKELRKDKRKQKKVNRAEYYQKKNQAPGKFVLNPEKERSKPDPRQGSKLEPRQPKHEEVKQDEQKSRQDREKRKQEKLAKEMDRRRRRQLKEANVQEDKMIKQLEKHLKLNKRKSKSIPKSFATDGLDYLLEVCDDENRKIAVETEKQLLGTGSGSEFEEDFALATGTDETNDKEKTNEYFSDDENYSDNESDNLLNDIDSEEDDGDDQSELESLIKIKNQQKKMRNKSDTDTKTDEDDSLDETDLRGAFDTDSDEGSDSPEAQRSTKNQNLENRINKRKAISKTGCDDGAPRNKKVKSEHEFSDEISQDDESQDDSIGSDEERDVDDSKNDEKLWEDIYGRTRDEQGNVLSGTVAKYVPPGARAKQLGDAVEDEKLLRLRKQIKGLLNRLAEYNMHNIASQIDDLYMSNSRNNMNETLVKLMMESIVAPVLTPDRLIAEHMMLIAILHANVGTEVGAHFLLTLVKAFDNMLKKSQTVENKELDNVILMISHLYNFKVYDSQLLYQILEKLSEKFTEKEVELILLILKSVGFAMRKDNPIALKELILNLQQKASNATQENTRVKFMVDVLLAIKNNNMNKIPQYDPSHVEHLKKVLKSLVRKGNYVTQMNISLDDLLKADERGKWWVVGSAWTGNIDANKSVPSTNNNGPSFSQKMLDLARKQRMNTDVRRNIFCVLMSAEDFLDAFEKLHHLGLKNQQEREVIYVIIDCCLQEKRFNPYYAALAQKFCDYDRKYQMTIQYTLWDKLKTLESYTSKQLTNLARFLSYLFIEKGLPLSALKVIQFGEMDKHTLRLMRQIILGILLHENTEACLQVFERISLSPQLHTFREGLRLFIQHFLLKNAKSGVIPDAEMTKLRERAEIVDKTLMARGSRLVF